MVTDIPETEQPPQRHWVLKQGSLRGYRGKPLYLVVEYIRDPIPHSPDSAAGLWVSSLGPFDQKMAEAVRNALSMAYQAGYDRACWVAGL